jgi:hypothetical protein
MTMTVARVHGLRPDQHRHDEARARRSPVKPTTFPQCNVNIAEHQPEYLPLAAYQSGDETISCWSLSWRERLTALWTGRVWLRQLTFRQALQPILLQVDEPEWEQP